MTEADAIAGVLKRMIPKGWSAIFILSKHEESQCDMYSNVTDPMLDHMLTKALQHVQEDLKGNGSRT